MAIFRRTPLGGLMVESEDSAIGPISRGTFGFSNELGTSSLEERIKSGS